MGTVGYQFFSNTRMASRGLTPYTLSVVVGSTTLKFPIQESSTKYTDDVGKIVGIEKTKSDDDFNGIGTVGGLKEAGAVLTLRVGYKVGEIYKTTKILCAADKFAAARGQLKSKTMFGSPIVSVGLPGRRSFR